MPMITAAHGATKPEAGVTAASPAIDPVMAPVAVGLPSIAQLTPIHARRANDPPSIVFTNANAATPFAASALPALKPNQPNHRRPAPRATYGTLCGATLSPADTLRGRKTNTVARAENPALMWTTYPPAKSITPSWARETYTARIQIAMNIRYRENRMRSANAPVIRAGVITANISWNAMKTRAG